MQRNSKTNKEIIDGSNEQMDGIHAIATFKAPGIYSEIISWPKYVPLSYSERVFVDNTITGIFSIDTFRTKEEAMEYLKKYYRRQKYSSENGERFLFGNSIETYQSLRLSDEVCGTEDILLSMRLLENCNNKNMTLLVDDITTTDLKPMLRIVNGCVTYRRNDCAESVYFVLDELVEKWAGDKNHGF